MKTGGAVAASEELEEEEEELEEGISRVYAEVGELWGERGELEEGERERGVERRKVDIVDTRLSRAEAYGFSPKRSAGTQQPSTR